jgi:hypothetical protein
MLRIFLLFITLALAGCGSPDSAKQSSFIRASGTGASFEAAKDAAFRKAIEERVGVLVLGERAIADYRLIKDEILSFSAGYVDDYRVVERKKIGDMWLVTADIWVSSSRITNRIFIGANARDELPGMRAAESFDSFIEQRRQADRLLSKLLSGFPQDALVIKFQGTDVEFDAERNALMTVNYNLGWNQNYLIALAETLAQLEDGAGRNANPSGKIRLNYQKPEDWLGTLDTFYFKDKILFTQIKDRFKREHIGIRLQIFNNDTVVFEECWLDSDWTRDGGVLKNSWSTVNLSGLVSLRRSVTYRFTQSEKDKQLLRLANQLSLAIVPDNDCGRQPLR